MYICVSPVGNAGIEGLSALSGGSMYEVSGIPSYSRTVVTLDTHTYTPIVCLYYKAYTVIQLRMLAGLLPSEGTIRRSQDTHSAFTYTLVASSYGRDIESYRIHKLALRGTHR